MFRMTTVPRDDRPAAALWDMDGTIINSEPLWMRAELAMLERYGLSFPEGGETKLIGSGLTAAAEYFRELGVPLPAEVIIEEWADGVIAGLKAEEPAWMPGARETLAEFRELGIPNVLVTMSVRRIADVVIEMLPEGTFADSITGDDVAHEKPHPDPYLRGAQAAEVGIRDCVAFEDSFTGTSSAAAAGAVVIGVPNLIGLDGSQAHVVLPTLAGVGVEDIATIWRENRATTEENN